MSAKPACSSRGPYDPGGRPLDQANEQNTSAFMPGHGEGHGVSSLGRSSCAIVLVYAYFGMSRMLAEFIKEMQCYGKMDMNHDSRCTCDFPA